MSAASAAVDFSIARLPRIEFGRGRIAGLPALAAQRCGADGAALLVCGARSLQASPHWRPLLDGFDQNGVSLHTLSVDGEPSAALIDQSCERLRADGRARAIRLVVGIGGGSVLDAAKALAGMLPVGGSVLDYLEGVGPEQHYPGPALPTIAVPTTAGTGSEATKIAVLGRGGERGFKKSFRDERLVPELALLDPDLLAGCPRPQIAANAMDALTQLLESYTSSRANPFTDGLAERGLIAVRDGLFGWYDAERTDDPAAVAGRAQMAYAALASGVCLAQTGLGVVHGLASPLGAFFPIPHGVVCGTLLADATALNLRALRARGPADDPAIGRYARAAELLCGRSFATPGDAFAALETTLREWTERLELPPLGDYGVGRADVDRIVANSRGSSMKTNPIVLSDAEIGALLVGRLGL